MNNLNSVNFYSSYNIVQRRVKKKETISSTELNQ